jgi:hypothetical protein
MVMLHQLFAPWPRHHAPHVVLASRSSLPMLGS